MKPRRDVGFALLAFLGLITVVAAATAAVGMLCVVESRAASEGDRRMRSFYLADTGAQIANALLTDSGGSLGSSNFQESLAGGSVDVDIVQNGMAYQVTSTGNYDGELQTVVMQVQFTAAFDMEGAIQVNFGEGIEVTAGAIPFSLSAASELSGMDHDADGNLLADQSNATYGLAMAPIPGALDVDVFVDIANGAELEGSPEATTSEAEGDVAVFNQLIVHARNNADIQVTGTSSWRNPDNGSYGTAADPQLVFVDLADGETLRMYQNFVGHGTLVISVGETTTAPALLMEDSTEWHGLVVIEFRGQAEVPGGGLVEMQNFAQIIGGLSVNFSGENTTFAGTGDVVDLSSGFPHILYSSELTNSASGVAQVVDYSSEVIAYYRN